MLNGIFALNGKTALVTGASYGIGVTFAQCLAAAGSNVVLAARNASKLTAVCERISADGGSACALPCDVADAGQVASAIGEAWQRFGRIDILVNNAGIAAEAGIMPEKVPHDLFEQTLRVNVIGLWHCCRETGARMLADGKGGSIVNIASVLGLRGQSDLATAYHASKAAVVNLTRHLALSWGGRGVRVNALAPGWFPSEMTAGLFNMPGFLEWAGDLSALKRIGKPEDLIGPLLFLASNASSFVTGHTLVVDGGLSCGLGATSMPPGFYQTLAAAIPGGLAERIVPEDAPGD